jgi:biopolymer transport protein ExbD
MKRFDNEENDVFQDTIDLTPMVNVSLILVIIFMCVVPLSVMTGIKALNSKSSGVAFGKSSKEDIVTIKLFKNGDIQINGFSVNRKDIVPYLKDAILYSPEKEVMIVADSDNLVKEVVFLMDISKQNGATKVTISE